MANISILSRLIAGQQKNVDLSANTLVVGALSTGTNTLTDAILGRLISLQNGTDVDATYHTHNTIYYTQTQLAAHATAGGSGAKLIGDGNTYTHITPASTTVEDALLALDAAVGSSTTATDSVFRIVNTSDPTKKIAFSAAGIATGTTRTITMPDANVDLTDVNNAVLVGGTRAFTANQSMGGFRLTNLADAISAQDAVTLTQLQNQLAGLDWKQHVRAMSDSNITLSGTQTVDGVALIAGDRILVQNQTSAPTNGIYVVAAGAWARSADADAPAELVAASVFVDEGTNYKGTAWVQTTAAPLTLGTSNILFVKFASILPLIFRNGLTQTGQNVDVTAGDTSLLSTLNSLVVNLATGSGLTVSSGIKINLESSNPTLQISTNQLGVKLDGARAITTGASGIGVNVDGTSVEINTNAIRIKTTAYDQVTITGGSGTAAAVASAPLSKRTLVAGEAFAANTTFAVRWALNGETAGRVYKADKDATSVNKYAAIGLALTTGGVSAGGNIDVVMLGEYTQGSADTAFGSTDVGKELFVGTTGALVLGSALAGTTGEAAYCIGVIQTTTKVWVDFKSLRGIS